MPIILPAPALVELNPQVAGEAVTYGSTVIAVPDIGKPHSARAWTDGSSNWLTTALPSLITRPRILEFQYASDQGDSFSWELLLHCGDTLLQDLLSRADDPQFINSPIVFICHGIGGIVAKRAIGILYSQYYRPNFDLFIQIVRGFVFLGTPHPLLNETQHWSKLASYLREKTKLSKSVINKNAGQVSLVVRISQMFTEPAANIPILTIIEGKPTNIVSNFRSSKQIIVDEGLAMVGSESEIIVKIDASHSELCNYHFNGSLKDVIVRFFRNAERNLGTKSMTATILDGGTVDWTISSLENNELVPKTLSQVTSDTMLATAGVSDMSGFEIIPLEKGFTGVANRYNLPLYMLKPHVQNPEFYGREDVLQLLNDELRQGLDVQGDTVSGLKSFALCGAGGLGKTQIAIEFAFTSKKYFDAVFLLQASDPGKLAQSYTEIAGLLGLDSEGPGGDQVVCKELVLEWLSNPTWSVEGGTRHTDTCNTSLAPNWLLIFDNADDLDVLRDFWPVSGTGSILITSRDPLAKTRARVSVANGLDLLPFSPEDGGQLLRNLTGYNDDDSVPLSVDISGKLTGIPLAIAQIAGTISRRDLGLAEFVELYDEETHRNELLQYDSGTVSKTLYTVWSFEDLSPAGMSLLNIIAFLDPDQISEQLLQNMKNLPQVDRHSSDYPLTLSNYIDARTELTKSSLVKRNRDRKELIIHRIIQDTTRARMGPDVLQATFESAAILLYETWPFCVFDHRTARWVECEPLVAHVGSIARYYEENAMSRTSRSVHVKLAALIMEYGWYYFERGNIPGALPYFDLSLRMCDLLPDSTQITAGDLWGCFAQIASTTNDPANAIKYARRSVEIFKVHDVGTFRMPQAYNELAEAYIAAGRWEEAVEQTDLAIQGYSALPPALIHFPDWAMMNKGLALRKLGRYDEASEVLEALLEFREKTFGPMDQDSFKTGQGFLFLAKVRYCQGRIPECLDLYLQALTQYHSTIGPKHFRVAAVLYDIGTIYLTLDEFGQAVSMFDKALEIYDDREEYSAHISRALLRRAEAETAIGQFETANATKAKAARHINLLSAKHGRTVDSSELDSFVPNWST